MGAMSWPASAHRYRRATATAQGIVVVATLVLGTIAALQTHEGDTQLADLGRAAFITFY